MTGDALNRDHFVVKLDPSATGAGQRAYSTYLGGLGDETEGGDIVADDSGKLWVTGDTTSTSSSFPVDDPMVVQPENAGGADGYVVAVDTTLTGAASRRWSTFLGGSEDDAGSGIAVDSLGTVWVGLNGRSDDLVLEAPLPMFELPSPSTGGGYLVRLSEDGETTLLTTPVPSATRLDVDGTDRIHLIGSTTAGHAIVDALPPSPAGQLEGFAAIVEPVADTGLQLTADGTTDTAAVGQLVAFRYTMTNRGESTATGLELTASVPAGLSNPAPPAGCLVASGQMTCQGLPDLAPGEDLRLSLRGTTVSTGILTTTGTANAAQADSVPGDNTAGATITVGSIPFSSPLPVASLDAVGATYDIGGFAIDTASGVDASANGSLDDVINFMWFDGSVPIRLLALRGGAEVALGFVERTTWTPSDGDGGDLFGREFNAPADRVFVAVDAFGRFELRSAAAFDPGVVIATGSLDLGHTGGLHLELAGGVARLYHGSALVAEASPFTGASGAATQAAVGDDQVLAVGFGLGELGSASFAGPELPLFADGFESGDTDAWSDVVP